MSDNIRTALYDAEYTVRAGLAGLGRRAPVLSRVVGKHCESGDIVVRDVWLPGDIAPGDLMAVAATGAYCRSMASNYNPLLRPPVVAVRDGAARAIVRRETEEDLLGLDLGCRRGRQDLDQVVPRPGRRVVGSGIGRLAGTVQTRRGARHRRGDGVCDAYAPLKVALLGCGVVGSEVARLMTTNAADLAARVGAPLELVGIAVRRPNRQPRPARGRPGAVHHRRRGAGRTRPTWTW